MINISGTLRGVDASTTNLLKLYSVDGTICKQIKYVKQDKYIAIEYILDFLDIDIGLKVYSSLIDDIDFKDSDSVINGV